MGVDPVSAFEQLLDQVRQRAVTPAAADRIDAAVDISAEHAATADRLLDHVVAVGNAGDAGNAEPEVRPEHLLAAFALDPGSRARRVLNNLGTDIAAIKGELHCHITLQPRHPARWWKRRTPPQAAGCSFCGRIPTATGRLVNGPGVRICTACVDLAYDILRTKAPA